MNNMFTDSSSPANKPILDKQTFNKKDSLSPLLPRSAWNSDLAFLRVVFRVKRALDEIEFAEEKKLITKA